MWWLHILYFLFFCSYLCADIHKELDLNGLKRIYIIHPPKGLEKEVPLVLFLHGAGGSASGAAKRYGWEEMADKEGFIVAFLEGTPVKLNEPANFVTNPNLWNDGSGRGHKSGIDDVGFIRRVIEEISSEYKIDPRRIYVTGFSNGASMTFRVGVELSDKIAAIAPVMGHLFVTGRLQHPVPLLLIAGGADPLNPLHGGEAPNPWSSELHYKPPMIDSVNSWRALPGSNGQEIIFQVIEGEKHQWPKGATETIWQFFKRHAL